MTIECNAKSKNGVEYIVDSKGVSAEWKSIAFQNYTPFCPFSFSSLTFSRTQMIKGGSGSMESTGKKFTIKPQTGFKTDEKCDADGYPEEKRFEF